MDAARWQVRHVALRALQSGRQDWVELEPPLRWPRTARTELVSPRQQLKALES